MPLALPLLIVCAMCNATTGYSHRPGSGQRASLKPYQSVGRRSMYVGMTRVKSHVIRAQ